jgi:hypothetical protein
MCKKKTQLILLIITTQIQLITTSISAYHMRRLNDTGTLSHMAEVSPTDGPYIAHTCDTRLNECFTQAFKEIHLNNNSNTNLISCPHYETYLFCYEMDIYCESSTVTTIAANVYARESGVTVPINIFLVLYLTVKKTCAADYGTLKYTHVARRTYFDT